MWVPETDLRFPRWQQVSLLTEPSGQPSLLGDGVGAARSLVAWSSIGSLGSLASEPQGSPCPRLSVLRLLITHIEATPLPLRWHLPAILVARKWK